MFLRPTTRHAIAAFAVSSILAGAKGAPAQTYPANRITIFVAFAPGGFADTMARVVGGGRGERLHQNVVVENRAGAGGNIAAALVAHSPPDGYTILATTTALAINETLIKNKQYSAKDLKAVAMVASSPETLSTSPSNPAADLSGFIKSMNARVINFASAGVGTGSHIEAEYFFKFLAKVPAHPVSRRIACRQCHDRQSGRSARGDAGRQRCGADARGQAQGSRRRSRETRVRGAERADLYGTGLSRFHGFIVGRLVRASSNRASDSHNAERGDQRRDQE